MGRMMHPSGGIISFPLSLWQECYNFPFSSWLKHLTLFSLSSGKHLRHGAPEQERQEEAAEGAVQTGAEHPRAVEEDHR